MDKLRDYIIAQCRESSTWRGLVDIAAGIAIEAFIAHVTFISSELTMALHTIAAGFIARGGIAVAMPDTTKAGTAAKVEKALEVAEVKATTPESKL